MPASRRSTLTPRPPLPAAERGGALIEIYARLDAAYRNEKWHWLPEHVRGPMDIIAGAILVQHTTWQSAERALEALRAADALAPQTLATMQDETLVPLIRISGTPTVKARRLRAVASTIEAAGGLESFLALPDEELRARLLATHGIGEETADAVMLYAAQRRTFVVDRYTRRLFRRIGVGPDRKTYAAWQSFFDQALPGGDVTIFQRYHAYAVLHSKSTCRATPRCAHCPLRDACETGRASSIL